MNESNKTEYLFLKLSLLFGLLYIFIIPPIQVADEGNHFKKAYLVSNLKLLPEMKDGQFGSYYPSSLLEFEDSNTYLIRSVDNKYNYSKFLSDFSAPKSYSDKTFITYSTSKTHPLLYLPQSLMMGIIKVLTIYDHNLMTPGMYLYAGRLGNLLFFIACIYFAIRISPIYKNLILLLGIMPMTLTLAASVSYDGMVIGISILLIATFFKFAYDNNLKVIGRKEIIILCLFAVALIELKSIYYPILFLFFLIPKNKFSTKKDYILKFVYMFFSGIVSHLLWIMTTNLYVAAVGDSSKYISDQLHYIITNPFDFILVILRTFKHLYSFYLNSFIGNLGWLDTPFPYIFILLFALLLIVIAVIDVDKDIRILYKSKLLFLAIMITIVVLLETSLYLIWTSIPSNGGIGNSIVIGVQGRYFIPFAIIGLVCLYSNKLIHLKIVNAIRDKLLKLIPTIAIYTCLLTTFILVIRYWISNAPIQ
ncbi:DUF2142 domain-containing protein [Paenibacillus nasutitermitis]|uniref:DUF2142 domain-containing protein n=1 Tax=Paenibacillus nasutitermitis TaxID=1652958 RepID=A0A916ZC61_9BACL|nr:DUF2142 domain-containing protein [Paenibacillus nasutitermitis]GGD87503.1 hypothetical protein GCM10010911_52420 [Paenibacillus nasutitermitis]